jgi:hypothetical protein
MDPKTIQNLRTALGTKWKMGKQSTVDKLCASLHNRLQTCLENARRLIFLDLFRLDGIRLLVGEPEVWPAGDDKVLPRVPKEPGTKRWRC